MKTLDEVIDQLIDCHTNWCRWSETSDIVDRSAVEDALHYLKVLKDILDPLKVKKITHEITCPQCNSVIAILFPESNTPLTWDELRQMAGKPVWVEVYDPIDEKTGWHTASWKLIEFINDEYFVVRDSDGGEECFYKSENDSYCWQAYRKERK